MDVSEPAEMDRFSPSPRIEISLRDQRLRFEDGNAVHFEAPVSTAARGPGEEKDSFRTPRGAHVVRARIGADAPLNTVFVGRRPTGEIYTPALGRAHPGRDWILTRILWLSGLEPGRNRLGNVDTMQRYIYIHGSPDEVALGMPGSHGCIRMSNREVVELFERVPAGTEVQILE